MTRPREPMTLRDHANIRGLTLLDLSRLIQSPPLLVYRVNRNPLSASPEVAAMLGAPLGLSPGDVLVLRPASGSPDGVPWLRSARLAKGLTQDRVGRLVGLSGSTISNYERGIGSPTNSVIRALRDHLIL